MLLSLSLHSLPHRQTQRIGSSTEQRKERNMLPSQMSCVLQDGPRVLGIPYGADAFSLKYIKPSPTLNYFSAAQELTCWGFGVNMKWQTLRLPIFSIIYSFEIHLSWAETKLIFLSPWCCIKLFWLSYSFDKLRRPLLVSYCPKPSGRSRDLAWARGRGFGPVPPAQAELWLPADPAEGSVVLKYPPLRPQPGLLTASHVGAPGHQWSGAHEICDLQIRRRRQRSFSKCQKQQVW